MTKRSYKAFHDAVFAAFDGSIPPPERTVVDDFEAKRTEIECTPAGAKILFWIARMAVAFDEFPDRIRILPGPISSDGGPVHHEDLKHCLYAVKEPPRGTWRLDGSLSLLEDMRIGSVVDQVLTGLGLPIFGASQKMLLEAIGYPVMPDVDTMDDIVSVLPPHVAKMLHLIPDAVFGDSWRVERDVALQRHDRWCHQLAIADVDIDGTLPNKRTLLMQAATMDAYVFDGLLLAGADVAKARNGRTVFDMALEFDQEPHLDDESILVSALKAYEKAGAEPITGDGRNPMRHLISRFLPGRQDGTMERMVQILIGRGIDPFATDKDSLDFDGALQEYRDRISQAESAPDHKKYVLDQLDTFESELIQLWRGVELVR